MKQRFKIIWLLVALFLLSNLSVYADGATNPNMARVRVVHASPNGPKADVYLDGQPFRRDVAFLGVTDYTDIPAGNHTIRILPAGSPPETPPVKDLTAPFENNKAYRIMLTGQLAQLKVAVIPDDLSPTPPNQARVTFVHISPGSPNFDICAVGQPACFQGNITYEENRVVNLSSGGYNLDVRQTGTNNNFMTISDTYQDGQAYTVFLMGLITADPRLQQIKALPIVTRPPTPPSNSNQGPGLPPHTGAFLAPEVVAGLGAFISLLILGGGMWMMRRRFS